MTEYIVFAYFKMQDESTDPTGKVLQECLPYGLTPLCFLNKEEIKNDIPESLIRSYLSQHYTDKEIDQIVKGEY